MGHGGHGRPGRRAARARALLALLAVATLAAAAGCDRATAPMTRCRDLQAWLYLSARGPADVIRACGEAHAGTGEVEALIAVAQAHLAAGHLDEVLGMATATPDEPAYARIWHLAGDVEMQRGNRAPARGWFERSLAAQRDRDPLRAFNTAAGLADLAKLDDDLESALDYAHRAIEQAAASRDALARMHASLALADLFLAVGDRRAAATTLDAVADLAGDRTPFGRDYLLKRGEVEHRAGRTASATAMYERCLEGPGERADPLVGVRCHLGLVRLRLATVDVDAGEQARAAGHLAAAAALEPRVLTTYGPDPDRDGERALLAIELALAGGRRAEAEAALVELSRRRLGTSLRARIATRLGLLLAEAGRDDEAEVALQDAAAAVEQLRDGAHYVETRAALSRELREPYEALFDLRARRGNVPGALAAMERALTRDFIDQLAAEPSSRADRTIDQAVDDAIRRTTLRRRLDIQAAADSRAATGAPTATVLAFFSARGRLWRVTIGPARAAAVEPIGDLGTIAAEVDAARDPASPAAAALAARLLPPAVLPATAAPVVVVPDRTLDGVRFAALRVRGRHLVELHPVILAPTLRIATSPATAGAPAGPPVVLGDPTGDLPGARAEAIDVAGALGVRAMIGAEATRAALAGARRASVLHVAAHGDRSGGRSALILHDVELTVGDLLGLHLAPDLAVVASCVSAAQDHDAMWTSIAAGLLASGAHGVLGVHGRLPDAVGRTMVAGFYRHGGARDPAVALARAQRDAIAAGVEVGVWSMMVYLGSAERAEPAATSSPAAGGLR